MADFFSKIEEYMFIERSFYNGRRPRVGSE